MYYEQMWKKKTSRLFKYGKCSHWTQNNASTDKENYRPISVLLVLPKIFKKIIYV